MSDDHVDYVEFEEATQDASWRMWSQQEFWLVLWLIESTASVTCIIPPEAEPTLWMKAEWLIDAILVHQNLRNRRREAGPTMQTNAELILGREKVAERLDALHDTGLRVYFRPSGRISAIELAIHPQAS
jgi:hypothetical protein